MGIKEKLANAKPSSSLTENMTDKQVEEIIAAAKEKARKRIAIYDALDSLRDFDMYSPYQKDLSIIIDYIEELEKENEDLKEAKAIYVERPKTMQEKQAESEKYEKAFDDGYENGYAQARFDYGQQPCEDVVAGTRSGQPITKCDLVINFNDKIKVKLTDLGKDIFYHQYDWILEQNPKTRAYIKPHYPKVDEEGYTTFLLWEFMQLYGKHIGMAAPNVILPLDIIKCEGIKAESEE